MRATQPMPPGTTPSATELDLGQPEKDREGRRRIIIALLFLLLSFSCIFCSSQSALWFIDRSHIKASMISALQADYGADISLELAPLEGDIAGEAEHDEALLLARQTPIAGGLGIVILPNPIPTPAPTVIAALPTLTPTATVPLDSGPSTPAPLVPTSTPVNPPTSPPPTGAPPTSPPPTGVPPTVPPPTSPPPTGVLPTVPPTVIPPTSPATVPPTVPPTSTPTVPPPSDTPTPPTVAFSAATFSVNENVGVAAITVVLTGASSQTITVNCATIPGGTATDVADYTSTSQLLTFTPGQTSQPCNIPINNDTLASEGDETVLLQLSAPTNAFLGLSNATLTILDDDALPTVQFSSPAYGVGEGDGSATITVNLVNTTSALPVTVNYTTGDGTATNGSDYTGVSNILTFAPGATSQTFDVAILDDTVDELDETVILTLSAPTNANLGVPNATLTITDDDALPTVQFSNQTYSVGEADGTATITVNLSAASGLTITVVYTTSDLTATAPDDYITASGMLTFPPGVTNQTFPVTIVDETPALDEPDEEIRLTLSNPSSTATLGTPNPATLTIVDNDAPGGPCSGIYPAGEPNIGAPNGDFISGSNFARIACDVGMILDLGSTPINTGHPSYDLVYYELQGQGGPDPPPPPYYIYMDLVQIQIGQTPDGPWFTVFEWGDGRDDTNTNIDVITYPDTGPAVDNTRIWASSLYGTPGLLQTGFEIDIDDPLVNTLNPLPLPSGTYQYVRIFSPNTGALDGPEVDAIEALP